MLRISDAYSIDWRSWVNQLMCAVITNEWQYQNFQPDAAAIRSLSLHSSLSNSSINSCCRFVTSLQTGRFLRLSVCFVWDKKRSKVLNWKLKRQFAGGKTYVGTLILKWTYWFPNDEEFLIFIPANIEMLTVLITILIQIWKKQYLLSTSTNHFKQLQRQTDCWTNMRIYKKGSTITTITNLCPEGQPSLLVGYLVEPEHRVPQASKPYEI
jgi:hypothetical protein